MVKFPSVGPKGAAAIRGSQQDIRAGGQSGQQDEQGQGYGAQQGATPVNDLGSSGFDGARLVIRQHILCQMKSCMISSVR